MSDAVLDGWQRSRLSWPPKRYRHTPATVPAFPRLVASLVLLALVCLLLALAISSLLRLRTATNVVAPPPEWLDVPRPIHIFGIEAPSLRALPLIYTARRRSAGDGREDMLAFGAPGLDSPTLRLRFYRRGPTAAPLPPLFAAIVQQAAEAGLSVSRSGLADLLPTRFGAFEIADVALTGAMAERLTCSGFRLALTTPALTIGGLACGAPGKPVARAELACLLDRVDLHSGGDDRAMIDFFAVSERRRDTGCHGAGLAPDALHAAWLDDRSVGKPATHPGTSRRH